MMILLIEILVILFLVYFIIVMPFYIIIRAIIDNIVYAWKEEKNRKGKRLGLDIKKNEWVHW